MVKEVPFQQTGLRVTVSEKDGVWLHFSADSGRKASINAVAVAERGGGVVSQAIKDWISDMKESV